MGADCLIFEKEHFQKVWKNESTCFQMAIEKKLQVKIMNIISVKKKIKRT